MKKQIWLKFNLQPACQVVVFLGLTVFAAQTLLVERKKKNENENKNKSNRFPAALLLDPLVSVVFIQFLVISSQLSFIRSVLSYLAM